MWIKPLVTERKPDGWKSCNSEFKISPTQTNYFFVYEICERLWHTDIKNRTFLYSYLLKKLKNENFMMIKAKTVLLSKPLQKTRETLLSQKLSQMFDVLTNISYPNAKSTNFLSLLMYICMLLKSLSCNRYTDRDRSS